MQSKRIFVPRSIIVDGSDCRVYRQTRHILRVDGYPVDLPLAIFRMMAILCLRRGVDSGWVRRSDLCGFDLLAKRYMSRAAAMIHAYSERLAGWQVVETDEDWPKFYRLFVHERTLIRMNPELVHFEDAVIAREAVHYIKRQRALLGCPGEGLSNGESDTL